METFILHDAANYNNLLPLTYTKAIGDLRVGILTITEKWEKHLQSTGFNIVPEYLSKKYEKCPSSQTILIRSGVLPDINLVAAIKALKNNHVLKNNSEWVALKTNINNISYENIPIENINEVNYIRPVTQIKYPWNIFMYNSQEISNDIEIISKTTISAKLSPTNTVIGKGKIIIDTSAIVEASILNTSRGDIYIAPNSEIMEGSLIRAPFALCEHSVLKMGAKIYGATTIGPYSKVGGEVNNSVIQGYSNKAHDGFLGNSVIGEWCNLGADTNNSNLKNNYAEVKMWNYPEQRFIKTGLQFCGLIMGDHSKCGINTMFNTGTVVGVSANIYGAGFPRNFIPSFSWGGASGLETFKISEVLKIARIVKERRNMPLTEIEADILTNIHKMTQPVRDKNQVIPS